VEIVKNKPGGKSVKYKIEGGKYYKENAEGGFDEILPKEFISETIGGKTASSTSKPIEEVPQKTPAPGEFSVLEGAGAADMKMVRFIKQGEKVADLIDEAKYLTFKTGNEHAVVQFPDGSRAIVSGNSKGIYFKAGQVEIVFGHTHPTSAPPSEADLEALIISDKSQQTVYHGGQVTKVRNPYAGQGYKSVGSGFFVKNGKYFKFNGRELVPSSELEYSNAMKSAGKIKPKGGDLEVKTSEKESRELSEQNKSSATKKPLSELLVDGEVPTNTNNEFDNWFNSLTNEEFKVLWSDGDIQKIIKNRIRFPGEMHEWYMVAETPKFKSWKVTMQEIKRVRTEIEQLKWEVPSDIPKIGGMEGGHGSTGSTTFHNELKTIIGESGSIEEFNINLQMLLVRWKINPKLVPPITIN
jgi:hypothetical protein